MDQGFNITSSTAFLTAVGLSPADILQLVPIAAYICDATGRLVLYNEEAARLWGRKPVMDSGMDHYSGAFRYYSLEGQHIPFGETPIAMTLQDGMPHADWQAVIERPDLSRILVKGNTIPLKDGHNVVTGVIHCFHELSGQGLPEVIPAKHIIPFDNITNNADIGKDWIDALERKIDERTAELSRKNEELKRGEERYHKMIEEVEDYAILLMDRSGVIQNWNKGAEKIKGYQESEIVGRHFSVFYLPEDRQKRLPDKLIEQATRTGKAAHEGWRMRKNGTRFWGSIVITALHDIDHNVIGFSKVTRDLTERKIAEDKIRQYASDLEFQNKELEQFAYAAAHDMKEPLRKIQFYNNYIFDNCGGELTEKAQEYLTRSIKAASRMQGLIDDLLTYSKASSFSQEREETNLNKIIDEVIVSHHDTIEHSAAVIRVEPLPVMRIIPFQFAQLFDNLIGNALKYRHLDRRPLITIKGEQVNMSITEKDATDLTEGCYYKFSVVDNGIGFEPEYAEKVFDLFQRLHTEQNIAGSGIGLAICKKIVLNHHGFITAKGIPGQGATFDVYIPCT